MCIRKTWLIAAAMAGAIGIVGCGDDDGDGLITADLGADLGYDLGLSPDLGLEDMGGDVPDMGTPEDMGPVDGGGRDCGALASRPEVHKTGNIGAESWTCDNVYVLDALTFVTSGTLSIEAGTVVKGSADGAALVITRDATIDAQGTAAQPIVFTSSLLGTATAPAAGNWGGVVLLGRATNTITGGEGAIEGISPSDTRGTYGGTDDAHDCGTIRYARIEYAGFRFGMDNELNGLTVGSCGTGTELDFIQVNQGKDDGVEFFGGTASIKHLVVTSVQDDSIDWDRGWRGNVQFFIAQQGGVSGEDRGIEGDNDPMNPDASPRTNPTIYNASFISQGTAAASGTEVATFKNGSAGTLRNVIFTQYIQGITIEGTATAAQVTGGNLKIENSLFFGIGPTGTEYFTAASDAAAVAVFNAAAAMNRFGTDPGLPATALDIAAPSFVPAAGSAAATGGATPPAAGGFFDTTATFVGAVEPGATTLWYAGWTRFGA